LIFLFWTFLDIFKNVHFGISENYLFGRTEKSGN
jgi:hypothetical protein